jgi:hypothetical protein
MNPTIGIAVLTMLLSLGRFVAGTFALGQFIEKG